MKQLLMGLMLLVTATAASAEWTEVFETDIFVAYADRATIRRNGNLVKMWNLKNNTTVLKGPAGESSLSDKEQSEYDCKDEKWRICECRNKGSQCGGVKGSQSRC